MKEWVLNCDYFIKTECRKRTYSNASALITKLKAIWKSSLRESKQWKTTKSTLSLFKTSEMFKSRRSVLRICLESKEPIWQNSNSQKWNCCRSTSHFSHQNGGKNWPNFNFVTVHSQRGCHIQRRNCWASVPMPNACFGRFAVLLLRNEWKDGRTHSEYEMPESEVI